jgi:hypothetical protein
MHAKTLGRKMRGEGKDIERPRHRKEKILHLILKVQNGKMCTAFILVPKNRGISPTVEILLSSHEGLCSMESVVSYFTNL